MDQSNKEHMIQIDGGFLERVYAQVAKIPPGKVATYGKIGELAGYQRAAREVGIAMSAVNLGQNLPCHRVVNKMGTLAPGYVFGSQEKQRNLLLAEGVTFLENGLINMEKHKWPNENQWEQLELTFDI